MSDAWTQDALSVARTKQASRAAQARNSSDRLRGVDPTVNELEYTQEQIEFMMAMDEYKKRSRRMFPTYSEILTVLKGLGYQKV